MKRLYCALLALAVVGCAGNDLAEDAKLAVNDNPQVFGSDIPEEEIIPGEITVHVTESMSEALEAATDEDGWVNVTETKASAAGAVRMRRLFPHAGRFEARTRAEGMHLWYIVEYDESVPFTKAANDFLSLPGVDYVEPNGKIAIVGNPVAIEAEPVDITPRAASSTAVFDDPRLSAQWHYYNNGQGTASSSGCDVNVFPVWKNIVTGNPDVIVAVVDQGVDFKHEDLEANIWKNPDKTGDQAHGYNFAGRNYVINAGDHGTHVAGTISAVNNNGKGVCGIAGGDSKKKVKGVKIMSCQIFDGNKSGSGAEAIKWGADNGAVISQNSWGMTVPSETSKSLKDAIDYFTKYAGLDEKGNQTGPMAGGLVIFAAGNDNSDKNHGTAYPGVSVSVSALGADYRRAYYSNYGSWVDIAAPGGDAKKGTNILSTLAGSRYGYMQGTSMACPHVSGVAALILSKYGGKGFTSSTLRSLLLTKTTDIKAFNPNYYLGKGLVNAYMSIAAGGGKAPSAPTNFKASVFSNNASVSMTVPTDEDDGTPEYIAVYYSKEPFTSTSGLGYAKLYVEDLKAGETLSGTIPGLDFHTDYYLSAVAVDLAGNTSKMTSNVKVTTKGNVPPEIVLSGESSAKIKAHETKTFKFTVDNPANHGFNVLMRKDVEDGIVLDTLDKKKPSITFTGADLPTGDYMARLVVIDEYGDADSLEVRCSVLENHKPEVSKRFPDRIFNSRTEDAVYMPVEEYFRDEDGETLNYTVNIEGNAANMIVQKGSFILTPMEYGYSTVTVTAYDVRKAEATQSFRVLVRNSDSVVDVYPNPVRDKLYLRTSSEEIAGVKVIGSYGNTVFSGTLPITAFEPAVVDMSSSAPGVYSVIVELNGSSYKFNIAKIQ